MSEKIIYLVPEPGMQGFETAYQDHSIDLPFRISKETRLYAATAPSATYEIPLGCRTYMPPEAGGVFFLPRSKASLLWPKEELNDKTPRSRRDPTPFRGISTDPSWAPEIKMWESCNLKLANTIAYIDHSYRGEWIARFSVEGHVTITPGLALLQAVPLNTEYSFKVVKSINDVPDELKETDRQDGKFGSSDARTSEPDPGS